MDSLTGSLIPSLAAFPDSLPVPICFCRCPSVSLLLDAWPFLSFLLLPLLLLLLSVPMKSRFVLSVWPVLVGVVIAIESLVEIVGQQHRFLWKTIKSTVHELIFFCLWCFWLYDCVGLKLFMHRCACSCDMWQGLWDQPYCSQLNQTKGEHVHCRNNSSNEIDDPWFYHSWAFENQLKASENLCLV